MARSSLSTVRIKRTSGYFLCWSMQETIPPAQYHRRQFCICILHLVRRRRSGHWGCHWDQMDSEHQNTKNAVTRTLFSANKIDSALHGLSPSDVDEFYFKGSWTNVRLHDLLSMGKSHHSADSLFDYIPSPFLTKSNLIHCCSTFTVGRRALVRLLEYTIELQSYCGSGLRRRGAQPDRQLRIWTAAHGYDPKQLGYDSFQSALLIMEIILTSNRQLPIR